MRSRERGGEQCLSRDVRGEGEGVVDATKKEDAGSDHLTVVWSKDLLTLVSLELCSMAAMNQWKQPETDRALTERERWLESLSCLTSGDRENSHNIQPAAIR